MMTFSLVIVTAHDLCLSNDRYVRHTLHAALLGHLRCLPLPFGLVRASSRHQGHYSTHRSALLWHSARKVHPDYTNVLSKQILCEKKNSIVQNTSSEIYDFVMLVHSDLIV